MKVFIDTEFNEYQGSLISMALVPQYPNLDTFYEVLTLESVVPTTWVKENVIPVLNKEAVSLEVLKRNLSAYLWYLHDNFENITIVADWPADIKYFLDVIELPDGRMIGIPKIKIGYDLQLSGRSKLPHNALADAIGLRDGFLEASNE